MAIPRLHVDAALAAGGRVDPPDAQAHYLRTVLRLADGAPVRLFNGRDGEWLARLAATGRRGAALLVGRQVRGQAPPGDLWLCFAPLKKARTDLVVEKAAELGAALVQPVMTWRTDPARVNTDRLRAIAIEAAEQCERLDVPVLGEPVRLDRLLADWPAERLLVAAAEAGPTLPIAALAAAERGRPAALLVGPEGGFAREELDALRELPFVRAASLGPRILRAETAAIAALSCWQALAGDWQARPPDRSMPDASTPVPPSEP